MVTTNTHAGYTQYALFAYEANYGSAATVTSSTHNQIGILTSIDPTESNNLMRNRGIGGDRTHIATIPLRFECGGTIEYQVQHLRFLKYALGSVMHGAQQTSTRFSSAGASCYIGSGCDIRASTGLQLTKPTKGSRYYNKEELCLATTYGTVVTTGGSAGGAGATKIKLEAAHSTLNRIDVISIGTADTRVASTGLAGGQGTTFITIVSGSAGGRVIPKYASVPPKHVVVALVKVAAAATSITDADIANVYWIKEGHKTEQLPSFTLEIGDVYGTDFVRTYSGCKLEGFTLSADTNDVLNMSCDWIAKTVTTSTSGEDFTFGTVEPFVFFEGAATYGGTTILTTNTLELSLANSLEPMWYINGGASDGSDPARTLYEIADKSREYNATINVNFENDQMYERFLGAVAATTPQDTVMDFSMTFTFIKSQINRVEFVCSECEFDEFNIGAAPEEIVTQDINVIIKKIDVQVWDTNYLYPTSVGGTAKYVY